MMEVQKTYPKETEKVLEKKRGRRMSYEIVDMPLSCYEEQKNEKTVAQKIDDELARIRGASTYDTPCELRLDGESRIKGVLEVTPYLLMFTPVEDAGNQAVLNAVFVAGNKMIEKCGVSPVYSLY